MEGSLSPSLNVWRESTLGESVGINESPELAAQLAAFETMRPTPRRSDTVEPFSLPWFLQIEQRRHSRHGSWFPRLMEFDRHAGDQLLAIGEGLGTDWVKYASLGAHVIVHPQYVEKLPFVLRNFELRGLHPTFTSAPIETGSMDIVHLCGSMLLATNAQPLIDEIYRVLKPGGKLIAILPSRRNSEYWQRLLLPWTRVTGTRSILPSEELWTGRLIQRTFEKFDERRIYKRQLRRSELPHLWRWVLLPIMERVMGRFLVLKTFKPISAAKSLQTAA